MRKYQQIATYLGVGVLSIFGMSHFAFASVLYTQPLFNQQSVTGANYGMPSSATTTLQNVHISYVSVVIEPNGTSPSFSVGFDFGSCSKVETYNFIDYGVLYTDISHFSLVTVPFPYTFPSDLTNCDMFFGGTSDGLVYSYDPGSPFPVFPTVSFCDTLDCPINGVDVISSQTRIISMLPVDGTTTPSGVPVNFELSGYISSKDVNDPWSVGIILKNRDQNTFTSAITLGVITDNTQLYHAYATTSGYFDFATSTLLSDGNYTVEGILFGGLSIPFTNLVSNIGSTYDHQEHQFVVGHSSFFGGLSQSGYSTVGGILGTLPSASTTDYNMCNPITWPQGGRFAGCMGILFIPDSKQMSDTVSGLYNGVLSRVPFGYLTRFYNILLGTTQVEPPQLSYTFGSSSPSVLQGRTYSIQLYDYLGTSSPLSSIRTDDGSNKSVWDVIDPPITTLTAIMVLFVILNDLLGFGIAHEQEYEKRVEGKQKMYQKTITQDINKRDYRTKV